MRSPSRRRSEIGGTGYRVLRESRGRPLIGMDVSRDALLKLTSTEVLRVDEVTLARPQG